MGGFLRRVSSLNVERVLSQPQPRRLSAIRFVYVDNRQQPEASAMSLRGYGAEVAAHSPHLDIRESRISD